MVINLPSQNNMEVWGVDIGHAYLDATTKEKIYIVAGPEFKELPGHIPVIHEALYGLKSLGLRWSQTTPDIMLQLGFKSCKAITSATIPQSVLNKRHKMLSYHRVREAIAAKILDFYCCASDQNKSHILGKHWEHAKSRTQ